VRKRLQDDYKSGLKNRVRFVDVNKKGLVYGIGKAMASHSGHGLQSDIELVVIARRYRSKNQPCFVAVPRVCILDKIE
jgi:hypothetical protein